MERRLAARGRRLEGRRIWYHILNAIERLQATAPAEGEAAQRTTYKKPRPLGRGGGGRVWLTPWGWGKSPLCWTAVRRRGRHVQNTENLERDTIGHRPNEAAAGARWAL